MIINIAVCDDEQNFLDTIQKELFQLANALNITIETYLYTDGNKVVDLIYNNKALIFSPFHNQSLRFFFVSLSGRDKATHKYNAKKAADCNTG